MRFRYFVPVIIVGLLLAADVSPARGELVTWGFSGEVDQVYDPQGFFGGAIGPGDPFEGAYTFESTTPDSRPDTPRRGDYRDAITLVSGHVGGVVFSGDGTPSSIIRVDDGFLTPLTDSYEAYTGVEVLGQAMDFDLLLYKNDGSFVFSDGLLTIPPALDSLTTKRVSIGREGGPGVSAELTNLWLVPEPGTLLMVAIGAAVVARRRRGICQE